MGAFSCRSRFILWWLWPIWACSSIILGFGGCRENPGSVQIMGSTSCAVSRVRFPTTHDEFQKVYANRTFYADGRHLGRDLALPEGAAIHPIACGTVRVYRAAQGYGTLAVVIEHRLPEPRIMRDGTGAAVTVRSFLVIYGHLRPTSTREGTLPINIRVGDLVGPDDVIGYVERDSLNGDGAEHLHIGIRLQTAEEAVETDSAWFRGYDTTPSQRRWFADPADFLPRLMGGSVVVRWHPSGTVLTLPDDSDRRWYVGEDRLVHALSFDAASRDHLAGREVTTTNEEINCYGVGRPYEPTLSKHRLIKFSDASTVYEYGTDPARRWTFISQEAFDSWGWKIEDVPVSPAESRPTFFRLHDDAGFRRLREGSLVQAMGESEVAVVSEGRRLPIFDWQTFLALGYQAHRIISVHAEVVDQVAYPRGPVIVPELVGICESSPPCFPQGCDAGTIGGGTGGTADLGAPVASSETCNGRDDDGNGRIDETFLCPLGKIGEYCRTVCGAPGFRRCEAPACDWSETCYSYPEDCASTIDEDCDGVIDCADADCKEDPQCRPKLDLAVPPDMSVADLAIQPIQNRGVRYEFRVDERAGWQANEPYRLRDKWWTPVICRNTGNDRMLLGRDGWASCELDVAITPFVGSFFSPIHQDWGDRGHLGTVGNAPAPCTPTEGIEWRLWDIGSNTLLFQGSAARLPCVTLGGQSRHLLP